MAKSIGVVSINGVRIFDGSVYNMDTSGVQDGDYVITPEAIHVVRGGRLWFHDSIENLYEFYEEIKNNDKVR